MALKVDSRRVSLPAVFTGIQKGEKDKKKRQTGGVHNKRDSEKGFGKSPLMSRSETL